MAEEANGKRRGGPRGRTLLSGKIIVGNCLATPDCVVRDLTAGGARVRISGAVGLPDSVRLLLVRDGMLYDSVIAWRSADEVGLRFLAGHDLRGEVDPAYWGVQRLWRDLAPR